MGLTYKLSKPILRAPQAHAPKKTKAVFSGTPAEMTIQLDRLKAELPGLEKACASAHPAEPGTNVSELSKPHFLELRSKLDLQAAQRRSLRRLEEQIQRISAIEKLISAESKAGQLTTLESSQWQRNAITSRRIK